MVGSLFGWKRADGTRRFRVAYNEIPRKNGKSTLAAGIGLYLLIADDEPGAEIYSAATKRDQAKIVWGEAKAMRNATPALKRRIAAGARDLTIEKTRSVFMPLGADADTLDGLNIHAAIIDELHAHKSRVAWDVIDTATGARRQPLLFAITTSGSDPSTVCYEQHDYSVKVLEGVLPDDEWFAYIATIDQADPDVEGDEGDDWADPKAWAKANPNLGVSVKLADLERKCRKARHTPSAQNAFMRLHLDVWTEQADRWISIAQWRACARPLDPVTLEGRECFGGLDISSKIDLTAFVLVFPPEDRDDPAQAWDVLSWYWIPGENIIARQRRDRVNYPQWVADGLVEATPGNVIEQSAIFNKIVELGDRYDIRQTGYDNWNAADIGPKLEGEGFELVDMRQGFKTMSGPAKSFEALVVAARFNHGGNPVLTWMASNLALRRDPNDNYMPDKAKSGSRIDGIVAAIMAIGRAEAFDPDGAGSTIRVTSVMTV